METKYTPDAIESSAYRIWEQNNHFKPKGQGIPFCIMLPPPNVTGTLHMGHGFQHTLMDVLTRYHRMLGDNTLWQPGSDHAGIATQMVVERQLAAKNQHRHDLGREAFVDKVWEWKAQSGDKIHEQMRRVGHSPDWSRDRFTMDEGLSAAVRKVFVQLYNENLIYRGTRLVNWDPKLQTAISDLEVLSEESQGSLWHFKYPLSDSSGHVVIATTRPETLLGDTAVAVHPDDARYQNLIGKTIKLPIAGRDIPIIADDYVDQDFGTGCVKITPAHDFNDYEVGQRHNLPMINILTKTATLNTTVPEAYQGLDRFVARKKIIAEMEQLGLLVKIDKHTLKVPKGDRSGAVIEPYLTDQWYVKIESLAKPATEAVKNNNIQFYPENAKNLYYEWMNNIQDWCISRQLWWGHRIPAWYDAEGKVYVGETEADVRKQYDLNDTIQLEQDHDVLDTWFSSALWPFSTLGWPDKTPELETYYPTSVLITGFDIMFFWVARMIMFGLKFMGDIPFKHVYFHGLIRDHEGKKMSKSKGNVLDPVDLIDGIDLNDLTQKRCQGLMQDHLKSKIIKVTEKQFPDGIQGYGADALRFTFCALASTSRDIVFDTSRLEGYRNFCNKLWNATRFLLLQLEQHPITPNVTKTFGLGEQWIWHQLNTTLKTVHTQFNQYRFDLAAKAIYDFVWHDFCDWYVEWAKTGLNSETLSAQRKQAIAYSLKQILEITLRLAHPIIPYITEALWQEVSGTNDISQRSIMLESYPLVNPEWENTPALNQFTWLQKLITQVRTLKAENGLKPGQKTPLHLSQTSAEQEQLVQSNIIEITALCHCDTLHFSDLPTDALAATTLVDDVKVTIPLAGLIDVAAESERINKQLAKLSDNITKTQTKLANPNFADKAPAHVVAEQQQRLEGMQSAQTELEQALKKLQLHVS